MKKVFIVALIAGIASISNAQEADGRKVQAGLTIGAGMSFNKVRTSNLKNDGVGSVFSIGTNVNFNFTNTIGLSTGLEFDFETLKYGTDSLLYYAYNDKDILQAESDMTGASVFRLKSRKQKPIYLTIPTMVTFRTKFIGYFRYFGKFGLRSSILLGNTSNDMGNDGLLPTNENLVEKTGMKAKDDMFFFKSSVGLSGGAEWNFTGTTSLVAEIGYFYGFINLYRDHVDNVGSDKTSKPRPTLFKIGTGGNEYFSNSVTQGQLRFKVSILF